MPSKRIRSSKASTVAGGGPGSSTEAFTDTFSLKIGTTDDIAAQSDPATFAIALATTDAVDAQSETLGLNISGHNDSNALPTDSNSFTMLVWLSGSAGSGVTNPSNANGQNDGSAVAGTNSAQIETAVAGANSETMTSALGANVPTATVTSVLYRGWFYSSNILATSTGEIILHSATALFSDIVMFTNSGLNNAVNHSTGTFTFDVIAAGVNTLAKLQSCEVYHRTTDVAAGVSPHTMFVDAGAFEIAGAF